jgi:hypothetical protein
MLGDGGKTAPQRSHRRILPAFGDPAMTELAEAHERVARDMQEHIDREAPPLAPE